MVLTEEIKEDKYPVASLEDSKIATEKQYYDIQDAYVRPKSEATGITDYVNDNGIGNNPGDPSFEATNSDKVYRLNSNANKTGLGITLKVMAGDKIDVFGKSYYFQNNPGSGSNNNLGLIDVLNGFLGNPLAGGVTGAHGMVTGTDINTTPGTAIITTLFGNQTTQNSSAPLKPRAFINVIFFDEQFKATDYKASIVGDNSTVKDHYADLQNLTAPKSGYVYIYCSNETPVNVFFDNLQVVHKRSAILEETHYYPFGLTMAGISSKSAGGMENKRKWNVGSELNTDFDINLYETFYRSLDPQVGRFWQVDPKPREYESPFASMGNNPISNIDPNGDYFFGLFGSTSEQRKAARSFAKETNGNIQNITKKSISVTFGVENETGGIAVSKTNFDKDGFPKILGQEARSDFNFHKNGFGFHKNHETGELEHTPVNGRIEMVDDPFTTFGPGLIRSFLGKLITKLGTSSGGIILEEAAEAAAKGGQTIIGEGMKRVSTEATKREGSVILNNMPNFTGTADQVTSQMMTFNRQWLLQQMRSGRPIIDIGLDPTRGVPSIFYQMEQNMIKNYLKLHPNAFQVIKP